MSSTSPKEEVVRMSVDDYWKDIKNDYIRELSNTAPEDVYPSVNPGPTTPEGGVNFECHCVSHLVGSPCGYEFRQAITCQKSSSESEMEQGACGQELLAFMECATRTQCFKVNSEEKKN